MRISGLDEVAFAHDVVALEHGHDCAHIFWAALAVFVGTRLPLATLLDYLEARQPLSEFLEDFPPVTREHAVVALEQAKEVLLARARSA